MAGRLTLIAIAKPLIRRFAPPSPRVRGEKAIFVAGASSWWKSLSSRSRSPLPSNGAHFDPGWNKASHAASHITPTRGLHLPRNGARSPGSEPITRRGESMSTYSDTVKAIYDCFSRGDIAGVLARLHPDVEWEYDWGGPTLAMYAPRHGREAVAGFFQALAEFEFVRFEPVAFLEGGDMIGVPFQVELIYKPNGRRYRDLEMHLWTFGADGLARRFRHLADTQQLAQVTA
jgi:ketosteroid isomerase-like protein